MEIKLQDFPCFYYTAKFGTKNDQLRYYATVTSMLGCSMEEAEKSAEYFSHVTKGKLFSNGTYSKEVLQETLHSCFPDNDAVHCNKLSLKKRGLMKDIVSKCCAICPLSSKYANYRQRDEYIYLKGIIEHPEWLDKYCLDSSQFLSMQSISLNNDVTFYVLPIASIIHNHLGMVNTIQPDKLPSEWCALINAYLMKENITEPSIVSEVPTFAEGIYRQIMHITPEEITESQMHAAWQQINSNYIYSPPRTVLPVVEKEHALRHERKQAIPPLHSVSSEDNVIGALSDEQAQLSLKAEQDNIMAEQGTQTVSEVQFPTIGASLGAILKLMDITPPEIRLEKPSPSQSQETCTPKDTPSEQFTETECSVINSEPMEQTCDVESLEADLSDDIPEESVNEFSESYDTTLFEAVPDDLEFVCPEEETMEEIPVEPQDEPVPNDTDCDSVETATADIAPENPTDVSDESSVVTMEIASEEVSPGSEANSSEPVNNMDDVSTELVPAVSDICALCSIGASTTYFHNVLRVADSVRYAFFLRCMSRVAMDEQFTSLRNKYGCALCPGNKRNKDCIYPSLSLRDNNTPKNYNHKNALFNPVPTSMVHKVTADFIPYIISCTDSHKSNLIDFITEACNATEIAIECVEMNAVKGLLFYVGGKFYFFDPAYGASGFLKPLLSDATKTTFYSMNPIQVHSCLYQMGFKRVRIESIAAMFSTYHNLDVLAPVGIIFAGYMHRAYIDDMYAHIMPYYFIVWKSVHSNMNAGAKKNYENGLRLEYALGKNKDICAISVGHEHNVVGGNYLHYRVTMRHLEDLNVPGCHIAATLNNSNLSSEQKKKIYEITAGKLGASTSRVHDYTYLLSLSQSNISYYCCYEDKVFFDEFMACLRSAFREVVGGTPDISAERTYFSL